MSNMVAQRQKWNDRTLLSLLDGDFVSTRRSQSSGRALPSRAPFAGTAYRP